MLVVGTLLLAVASLAIAEAVLRQHGYGRFGVERSVTLRESNPGYQGREFVKAIKLEESKGLEAASYQLHVDENGFLRDAGPMSADRPTYVLLGGSQIEGLYLPAEGRVDVLVEERLAADGHAANVVNGGKSGNHAIDSTLVFLTKVIPMQPQRVYLLHNTNDQFHLLTAESYWPGNHERQLVREEAVRPWHKRTVRAVLPGLYQFASQRLWQFRASRATSRDLEPFAMPDDDFVRRRTGEFQSALSAFAAIAHEWGIEVVLVTQFTNYGFVSDRGLVDRYFKTETDFARFRRSVSEWNAVIRHVARESKTDLFDADRELSDRSDLYYDALHLNEQGMRAFADLISDDIIQRTGQATVSQ